MSIRLSVPRLTRATIAAGLSAAAVHGPGSPAIAHRTAVPHLARRAESHALTSPQGPAWAAHELIVGYRPARLTARTARMMRAVSFGTASLARAAKTGTVSRTIHLRRGETVRAAIARLRHQPGVAYALPDYIAHQAGAFYPNDPGRSGQAQGWEKMQWNLLPLTGVDAPDAWANLLAVHRPGGRGVKIAVLDTGIAYRDWKTFRESPDFRGTRFIAPYDFVAKNHFPLDRNGHGTFVAGVIAEATNNRIGLTGLAYGASIMPVRILDGSGLGDETTIAKGIRYAVTHGAQIINLSLEFLPNEVSSAADIPQIVSAINFAHARGVMVVGAAGNDQSSQIAYPARARNAVAVGATTRDLCVADYSNNGSGLTLVAPGGGSDAIQPADPLCHPDRSLPSIYQLTLTATPHWGRFGYPGYYIGTSMSAPEVSATAALVIASGVIGRRPSPAQILARLEQTATPLGGASPNTAYGFGLVNAGNATSRHPILRTAQSEG